MPNLRAHNIVVSLDGYATGEGQSLDAAFGHAQPEFMEWFRPTTGPWPEDGWRGWWGEDPPFRTPCFVMTHYEREPITAGDTTYHFVCGTPAEVLQLARKAAATHLFFTR
jgi:hypothetical protein